MLSLGLAHGAPTQSNTDAMKFMTIDSLYIIQTSKEGQVLTKEIQGKADALQAFIMQSQKELVDMQEELKNKKDVLSKDAIQEKVDALTAKKKRAELELSTKQDALRTEIQRKQVRLRDKQLSVTEKVFKAKNWGMLIDKNTPGVLCVNNAIDKTKELLKIIDAEYEKEIKTTKTAKAPVKRSIKLT